VKRTALFLTIAVALMLSQASASNPADWPITKTELDNGLKVIVLEDHSTPAVAVHIWYHVGSKNERPGITGI
jgi:zinc protease